MEFDLFLKGMQNKETTASAWLATLLRDDPAFRREFFRLVEVNPPLDPVAVWKVDIETPLGGGACDVTLEDDTTYVFLENKVSLSARRLGQFIQYYRGAIADPKRASKRVIGIYLGPNAHTGTSELAMVVGSEEIRARGVTGKGDYMLSLGWQTHLAAVVESSTAAEDWFARNGLRAILDHVIAIQKDRPFDEQRDELRRLMQRVAHRIQSATADADSFASGVRLDRWPSRGQEALYTPNLPVTTWLTLRYDEAEAEPHDLDVFTGDAVNVHASVSFNPSTKIGLRDPVLMERWKWDIERRAVEIPGIGPVPARNDLAFEYGLEFHGSPNELEDLMVSLGTSVIKFLSRGNADALI